jgi:hypothetical protein
MATHIFDIATDFAGADIHADRLQMMCDAYPIGGSCTVVDVNPKGQSGKVVLQFSDATLTATETSVYLPEVLSEYNPADGPLPGAKSLHGDLLSDVGNINNLAEGEVLGMVGGVIVGRAAAGLAGAVGSVSLLRRVTVLHGVGTEPVLVNFDRVDRAISAAHFIDAGGVLEAQGTFTAKLEAVCSVGYVSGTNPTATLILQRNSGEVVGKAMESVAADKPHAQLEAKGVASFEVNNELSVRLSVSEGEVQVPSFTALLMITIVEEG